LRLILARLVDLVWYWFVGYRYGDADGVGKLRYLTGYYATKAAQK